MTNEKTNYVETGNYADNSKLEKAGALLCIGGLGGMAVNFGLGVDLSAKQSQGTPPPDEEYTAFGISALCGYGGIVSGFICFLLDKDSR